MAKSFDDLVRRTASKKVCERAARRTNQLLGPERRRRMPQLLEIPELRLSARSVIRPGDRVRLSGGPRYKATRLSQPGIYRVRLIWQRGKRYWIEADRLDRQWQVAGIYTLFVAGPPFRSKLLDTIVNRPYRVRKCRK
jgi:hypothetical protein